MWSKDRKGKQRWKKEDEDNSLDLKGDRPMIVKTRSLSDLDTRPNNKAAQLRLEPTDLTTVLSPLSFSLSLSLPSSLSPWVSVLVTPTTIATSQRHEMLVNRFQLSFHVSSQHLLQVTTPDFEPDFQADLTE